MSSAYSIEELQRKTDAQLLCERGRGPEHNSETHERIAAEMTKRGCKVPPIPAGPVRSSAGGYAWLRGLAFAGIAILAVVVPMLGIIASLAVFVTVFCIVAAIGFVRVQVNGKTIPAPLSEEEHKALAKGAKDGVTELMIVAASGNIERATDLLNYGAGLNDVTKSGLTPLMYAAANGRVETYRLLLSRGAERNRKTKNGKSAFDLARENGHQSFSIEIGESTHPHPDSAAE